IHGVAPWSDRHENPAGYHFSPVPPTLRPPPTTTACNYPRVPANIAGEQRSIVMKALVYTEPNVLLPREEPEPAPGNDEVLVRVEAVGICGSDMHAYHGHDSRRPPPLVLGHEAAGIVVSGPDRGARVAVNPLVPCGVCDWCLEGRPHLCPSRQLLSVPPRAGAFAELVRVPERNVVKFPDGLDSAKAALTEPLAC